MNGISSSIAQLLSGLHSVRRFCVVVRSKCCMEYRFTLQPGYSLKTLIVDKTGFGKKYQNFVQIFFCRMTKFHSWTFERKCVWFKPGNKICILIQWRSTYTRATAFFKTRGHLSHLAWPTQRDGLSCLSLPRFVLCCDYGSQPTAYAKLGNIFAFTH